MLTDTQEAMIAYHIGRLIDMLEYFFVRLHNNEQGHSLVADLIKGAILNKYAQLPYGKNSLHTAATPSLIARELNGIFHPDFDVLNSLSIINNPRDPVKISREAMHGLVDEIQEYSLQILQKHLTMPKYSSLEVCLDFEKAQEEQMHSHQTFQMMIP